MFAKIQHIHFVGIGGIGMSGLAEILLDEGFSVSGSDLHKSDITERLEALGATIYKGHSAEHIAKAEVVVYSSAVKPRENPETKEAIEQSIPLIRRAEMLAEVTRLKYSIGIAGTHGKTTTTSMCGLALMKGDIDPTVIVGGKLSGFGGTNARLGRGQWTVVEADEYDRSFLQLSPTIALITNIEEEHLDIYADFNDLRGAFSEFANKVPFYGVNILCLDDDGVLELLPFVNKKKVTYGLSPQCDIRAVDIEFHGLSSSCTIIAQEQELGRLSINIPGLHNLRNALGAVTAGLQLEVPFTTIAEALKEFTGVYRRFEKKGIRKGVTVVDDYAHHPTEVQSTLQATRNGWKGRIIAVFQPHTFTRTRDFYKDFAKSFFNADILVLTDIYAAREEPIEGINGELIARKASEYGHKSVHYISEKNKIPDFLSNVSKEGDIILTIGAGDIWKYGERFLELP